MGIGDGILLINMCLVIAYFTFILKSIISVIISMKIYDSHLAFTEVNNL